MGKLSNHKIPIEEGYCGVCKRSVWSDEPNHQETFDDGQYPVHDKCWNLLYPEELSQ